MDNKKWILIIGIIIGIFLIWKFGLFGLFSISEFTDVWLTQNSEGFYHYAIVPPMEGSCRWIEPIVTNNNYNFNRESKIKIRDSEFKFVITNLFRPSRPGSECAAILYDIDIYRNNIKIDSISSSWIVADIISRDSCAFPCWGSATIYRAYDVDGNVYKQNTPDFSVCSQKINLSNSKIGIEVQFGIKNWLDGAMTNCRNLHIVNKIDVIYPNLVISEIKNYTISGGIANINLRIMNNHQSSLKTDYGLLIDTGIVAPYNIYANTTNLNIGENIIKIPLDVSSAKTSITLIPYVKAYDSTSNLLNLNGVKSFRDSNLNSVSSSSHSYYLLGEHQGNPSIISPQICNPADTDCNNQVSFQELINYANKWKQGQVTFAELIQAGASWKAG